jgi:adenine-specific DNA-methyltransferase
MERLAAAKLAPFQLTVTSPPYNIGKEYEQSMPMDEYVAWCARWCGQVHALTTRHGAFWLNVGYVPLAGRGKAVPLPYLLWDKTPFFLMQEVVWNYGAGVACRNSFSPRNEKFLWYVKTANKYTFNLDAVRDPDVKYPNQKKNGVLRCNPNGKNPSDVWAIPKITSGEKRSSAERTAHPAQFPVAVIERVVLASSNQGDLVLDPFMGSGTTAEVALAHGRKVVGFEIREDYCKIAVDRLRALGVGQAKRPRPDANGA